MRFHGNELKTRFGNFKNIYPFQAILLSLVFNILFQRFFKESITAFYDQIEHFVGTKF